MNNVSTVKAQGEKAQQTLTIHISSICPFQCLPSEYNGSRGIFYDISERIFSAAGYNLLPVYAPFSRAILLAQQGKLDVVTTLYKDEVAGLLYPEEYISYGKEMFFVRSDDPWRYTGLSSLADLQVSGDRVLVAHGYDYGDSAFKQFIKETPELFLVLGGGNTFERAVHLLLNKRVRVVVFDRSVMAYSLARLQLEGEIIPAGAVHQGKKLYIGISAKTADAGQIMKIFDAGLKQFKSSRDYQLLLAKYNINFL
ncbi:substrate-binding periplasmic protein [Thalassomonas actiniarum]|uniref:Transporter substrate-binding domain-containing protein n=1 Tax=Thalassomonas actiniarum TaxID=485447 RepID=A0AAF0BWX4_9GAMM|nr:transporter substrate-binding domain-containing protein [Thalassomonas actiniarum]WDD96801.1 transporter substrate-binding domain-containing protein [Thalassomonas actiniarum]